MATKKQCESCKAVMADMSVTECEFCNGSSFTHVSVDEPISQSPSANVKNIGEIPLAGRTASQHKEVVEKLVQNLSGASKYAKAVKQGEFAAFSFIGTNDWEDYASLSINALNALSLANISSELEAIRRLLETESTK
jgi:hypothetical protein